MGISASTRTPKISHLEERSKKGISAKTPKGVSQGAHMLEDKKKKKAVYRALYDQEPNPTRERFQPKKLEGYRKKPRWKEGCVVIHNGCWEWRELESR